MECREIMVTLPVMLLAGGLFSLAEHHVTARLAMRTAAAASTKGVSRSYALIRIGGLWCGERAHS